MLSELTMSHCRQCTRALTLATWQSDRVKARFDNHVITVTEVALPDGHVLPVGTHGFVIEAFESPKTYEIEFDLMSN